MITDQIKRKMPLEITLLAALLTYHFIDDVPNIKIIDVLVNKQDDYKDARQQQIYIHIILKIKRPK